jgi:hypothetical protein
MDPNPCNALPTCTTERLLAVADIIEHQPEKWEQMAHYFDDGGVGNDDNLDPADVAGLSTACGTTACIAGWGIVLNPDFTRLMGLGWTDAGAVSLGLRHQLAAVLFDPDLHGKPAEVADLLRHIAKVPMGHRTLVEVEKILPDELRAVLRTSFTHPEHRDDE